MHRAPQGTLLASAEEGGITREIGVDLDEDRNRRAYLAALDDYGLDHLAQLLRVLCGCEGSKGGRIEESQKRLGPCSTRVAGMSGEISMNAELRGARGGTTAEGRGWRMRV